MVFLRIILLSCIEKLLPRTQHTAHKTMVLMTATVATEWFYTLLIQLYQCIYTKEFRRYMLNGGCCKYPDIHFVWKINMIKMNNTEFEWIVRVCQNRAWNCNCDCNCSCSWACMYVCERACVWKPLQFSLYVRMHMDFCDDFQFWRSLLRFLFFRLIIFLRAWDSKLDR